MLSYPTTATSSGIINHALVELSPRGHVVIGAKDPSGVNSVRMLSMAVSARDGAVAVARLPFDPRRNEPFKKTARARWHQRAAPAH